MPRFLFYIILIFLIGITPLFGQGEYFQKGESGFDAGVGIHGLKDGHGFGAELHYTFWGLGDIGFEIGGTRLLSSEQNRYLDKTTRIYPRLSFVLVRDREGMVPLGLTGSLGFLVGSNEYTVEGFGNTVIGGRKKTHGALILGLTFYRDLGDSAHPAWQPFVRFESRTYAGDAVPENSIRFTAGVTNYISLGLNAPVMGITPSYMRERDNWAISFALGLYLKTAYTKPDRENKQPRRHQTDQW